MNSFKLFVILVILIGSVQSTHLRQKRGLRSWLKKLLKGDTTTTVATTTRYSPTTRKYVYTTPKSKSYYNTPRATFLPKANIQSDTFYKLKKFCESTSKADRSFCEKKRIEIKALISKCDKMSSKTVACKEIDSIYCYVYDVTDYYFCRGRKYDKYIPGYRTPATVATTSKPFKYTSTRKYKPYSWEPFTFKPFTLSPFTYRTISIDYITTKKPYATTRRQYFTTRHTVATTAKSISGGSPFGSSRFTELPSDPAKIKEIGVYCKRVGSKDANCNTALNMIKTNFKKCEHSTKSDRGCQTFKESICQAFPNFACCADILAGRPCSGKSANRG